MDPTKGVPPKAPIPPADPASQYPGVDVAVVGSGGEPPELPGTEVVVLEVVVLEVVVLDVDVVDVDVVDVDVVEVDVVDVVAVALASGTGVVVVDVVVRPAGTDVVEAPEAPAGTAMNSTITSTATRLLAAPATRDRRAVRRPGPLQLERLPTNIGVHSGARQHQH
jgi:hypothetical protein